MGGGGGRVARRRRRRAAGDARRAGGACDALTRAHPAAAAAAAALAADAAREREEHLDHEPRAGSNLVDDASESKREESSRRRSSKTPTRLQGRAAYVCRRGFCARRAMKTKGLGRGLKAFPGGDDPRAFADALARLCDAAEAMDGVDSSRWDWRASAGRRRGGRRTRRCWTETRGSRWRPSARRKTRCGKRRKEKTRRTTEEGCRAGRLRRGRETGMWNVHVVCVERGGDPRCWSVIQREILQSMGWCAHGARRTRDALFQRRRFSFKGRCAFRTR